MVKLPSNMDQGLSGENVPMIQFYEINHLECENID